jgi:hypothetical protein
MRSKISAWPSSPGREAAVHGDPTRLDALHRGLVVGEPAELPVAPQLDAVEPKRLRALEADQHLPAAALAHEVQQLRVVGDRDVGLGEPVDALVLQGREQPLLEIKAVVSAN